MMRAGATRFAVFLLSALLLLGQVALAIGEDGHAQPPEEAEQSESAVPGAQAAETPSGESWMNSILGLFGMGEPQPAEPVKPDHSQDQSGQASSQAESSHPEPSHSAPAHDEPEHAPAGKEHASKEHAEPAPQAETGHEPENGSDQGWFSSLLGLVGLGGSETAPAETHGATDGTGEAAAAHGEKVEAEKAAEEGDAHADKAVQHHDAPKDAQHGATANAGGEGEHKSEGAAPGEAHAEQAEDGGGGWLSSLLGLVGLGGGTPAPAEGEHAKADPAAGGAQHGEADKGESGHEGEHAGEGAHAEGEEPPPPPLWPEKAAVEDERQPFVLVRKLRALQDRVAYGQKDAYELQKSYTRDIGEQMRALPPQVWDDTRNVRAAVYFVLTGGDPRVLTVVAGHKTPIYVPRRLIRGALAYGEGRLSDALMLLGPVKARELDPMLSGVVAFIQATLHSKRDPKSAVEYFDEARLLSPGTLIEESALRQSLLIHARDGNLARFDQLSDQYSRRFGRSLFARTFRRQFFSGVARQDFKGGTEWISRTEVELNKVSLAERASIYLSIAEEATKGGHIEVARFAARKAAELYRVGTRERLRADLYHAAALVATDEVESGLALLAQINPDQLQPKDRELYAAASGVGGEVLRAPAEPQEVSAPLPQSVTRAQEIMSSVDAMFSGGTQ